MSVFVSVGIVILAMLIMAFLQLSSGVFSLFYHYASGKYSKSRASDMTLFFILGTETAAACLFFCSYLFWHMVDLMITSGHFCAKPTSLVFDDTISPDILLLLNLLFSLFLVGLLSPRHTDDDVHAAT